MRRMSFAMTEAQLLDGSKTVTRRKGWESIKPGDQIQAIDKLDFRRKGGSRVLGVITVVSVRRERLDAITDADVAREGFPTYTADQFIAMFCKAMRCSPGDLVTRIEFKLHCHLCGKCAPAHRRTCPILRPPAQLTLGLE